MPPPPEAATTTTGTWVPGDAVSSIRFVSTYCRLPLEVVVVVVWASSSVFISSWMSSRRVPPRDERCPDPEDVDADDDDDEDDDE